MTKLKTSEMEVRLMMFFGFTRNLIVPAVTNAGKLGFEADLLVLSPAGYATAIEIKVSKSDLRNDLNKKHIKQIGQKMEYSGRSAFEFYYKPLKFFYYAVTKELEKSAMDQIPDFAGLIVVDNHNGTKYPTIKKVKPAKELFKNQWNKDEISNIARIGTMRLYNLKFKLLSKN